MALGFDEIAAVGEKGELLVREGALPLKFEVVLNSSDGDEVRVRVGCEVRIVASEADRRVFRQAVMAGRRSVRTSDVEAVWGAKVREAASGEAMASEQWVRGAGDLTARVRKRLEALAYTSGMELFGEVTLAVACPAWELRQAEVRRLKERDEAEARRLASARRAAELLAEARAGGVAASELLARAGADEGQSLLLAALGRDSAARATVWCVAGGALVSLTCGDGRWEPAVRELPGDLGPLRSVFVTGSGLLVGARDGVWLVTPDAAIAYREAAMAGVEHGFSAVCLAGEHLWGAHRQRGLVAWHLHRPEVTAVCVRPPVLKGPPPLPLTPPAPPAVSVGVSMVRTQAGPVGAPALPGTWSALMPLPDGRVLAAGADLAAVSPDGAMTAVARLASRCVLLADVGGRAAAVCEDGSAGLFEIGALAQAGELRVGETVASAAVLAWSGGARLVCATPAAVLAVGADDPVTVRYASAHRGLREVGAGCGVVAAVSADRMRVVIWDAWEPRRPAAEVHVGGLVRGRVADVAVG